MGVKINGGGRKFKAALNDYAMTERINQAVVEHNIKTFIEACYFALKIGRY